jgi:hypothetical protein
MYERTHRWMLELQIFPEDQSGAAEYDKAVLV